MDGMANLYTQFAKKCSKKWSSFENFNFLLRNCVFLKVNCYFSKFYFLCFLLNLGQFLGSLYTPVPINNLLALHKQYTDCPTNLAGYEVANLYKSLLFIRNIL